MMVGPNARERQILDVALRLFSERAYRETSLKDIADVLGITRPACDACRQPSAAPGGGAGTPPPPRDLTD